MVLEEQHLQKRNMILSLLKHHGTDSLSYFHLQDNRQYFFSPSGKSFISYVVLNKIAVVGTDPVGPVEEIPSLIASFLSYLANWNLVPCFIGLSESYTSCLSKNGLRINKIGEEAILNLSTFSIPSLRKKVKRAVRHVEENGASIFFFNPINIPLSIRDQIEEISVEWLKDKGGREKGFSMTLKRIPTLFDKDCQIVVAVKKDRVLGYLCFVPAYQSNMLSLDHSRRRRDVPNGLNEFLISKAAEYFKEKGVERLSLNFATFSHLALPANSQVSIKGFLSAFLEKMYKCHTLRSFNEKFYPVWESRYIAFPSMKYLPFYLLAILRAER